MLSFEELEVVLFTQGNCTRECKKSSPNCKLAVYLSKRDFN